MSEPGQHVVALKVYLGVFAALMVGTALTYWAALLDLGPLNPVVALGIAVAKATLVVLYFMHVRYATRLTALVVVAAVLWLALLLAGTMSDYLSRPWLG